MNVKDFAVALFAMNSEEKIKQAVANLKHGIKHCPDWNATHKEQVQILINFLESGKKDVAELDKFFTIIKQ